MAIDNSKTYVVCTDRALSGWGMAKGKDNVLCFECDTYAEAVKLYDFIASHRSEMSRLRINCNRPKERSNWYLQDKDKTNMPEWYRKAGIC